MCLFGVGGKLKELEISKHELVPRHELLNEKEREEVLKKFGITLRQLPRVLVTDPMVINLNAKIGDVIQISRKSETAGEAFYYRVVIKG